MQCHAASVTVLNVFHVHLSTRLPSLLSLQHEGLALPPLVLWTRLSCCLDFLFSFLSGLGFLSLLGLRGSGFISLSPTICQDSKTEGKKRPSARLQSSRMMVPIISHIWFPHLPFSPHEILCKIRISCFLSVVRKKYISSRSYSHELSKHTTGRKTKRRGVHHTEKGHCREGVPVFEMNMATFHGNPSNQVKVVTKLPSNQPKRKNSSGKIKTSNGRSHLWQTNSKMAPW